MKKQNIIPILFILFSIFIIISSTTATLTTTGDIWQIINGNTITQNNTNLNVNIGDNSTTTYKLSVNGTTFFNRNSYFNQDLFMIDGDLNTRGEYHGLAFYSSYLLMPKFILKVDENYDTYMVSTKNLSVTSFKNINITSIDKLNLSSSSNIGISSNNLIMNSNVKINKKLNVSDNVTLLKKLSIFGYNGTYSKFYSNPDKLYNLTISNTGDLLETNYFKIVSTSNINITASNIILNGNLGIDDNVVFKFGTGTRTTRDFGIAYNPTDSSLRFIPYTTVGLSSKLFYFNPTKKNTDFVINGQTDDKVFNLDASINKINMTKVNITSLLTIPCISTGATLTSYQVTGSLLLNTTTNLIGSYNGISWKWH